MPHISFHFSFISRFLWIFFVCYLIVFSPSLILLPNSILSLPHLCFPHISSKFLISHIANPDHTRKIELIRYLMSGYVNGKVLDTLSEHANALASSAVANLEDEANQLSHFPFLPVPNDPVIIVPKHHGWCSRHCSS